MTTKNIIKLMILECLIILLIVIITKKKAKKKKETLGHV